MTHRILLAGLTMMLLAGCVPANSGYVRDDYDYNRGRSEYRRGCENCGQILRIESIGNEVERDGQRRSYFRILVRMDSGRTRAFEQYRIYDLRRGDRVYIDNGLVVPGY